MVRVKQTVKTQWGFLKNEEFLLEKFPVKSNRKYILKEVTPVVLDGKEYFLCKAFCNFIKKPRAPPAPKTRRIDYVPASSFSSSSSSSSSAASSPSSSSSSSAASSPSVKKTIAKGRRRLLARSSSSSSAASADSGGFDAQLKRVREQRRHEYALQEFRDRKRTAALVISNVRAFAAADKRVTRLVERNRKKEEAFQAELDKEFEAACNNLEAVQPEHAASPPHSARSFEGSPSDDTMGFLKKVKDVVLV